MLSRSRLPAVVHVIRSNETLSHDDLEVLREIIRRVALRMLKERSDSAMLEK